MKEIEQSDDGQTLAICYQDDGAFRIMILKSDGTLIDDVNVSSLLGITNDKRSKPIEGFWEPMITCCFVPANKDDPKAGSNLMVCVYHRITRQQTHFIYSISGKCMVGYSDVGVIEKCTPLNFPIKSFYSAIKNEVYTFYR